MRLRAATVLFLGLITGCNDPHAPSRTSVGLTQCGASNVFDRDRFTNSSRIDCPWMPLEPGMQFIQDGQANRGGGLLPHRVVFTVTSLKKEIEGVESVVMWDRDYNDGALQEAELAFFAQDDRRNVWTMGEYPEEFENGIFIGAPSTWISGLAGAEAGILVPGEATLGVPFLQGSVEDIRFLDCGSVYALGQTACVPFNCFENVLVVDEWSPLEPGSGHQRKSYAPGVGVVQVGAVDDPEGETLVLVDILRLTPAQLEAADREALRMEDRAYRVSPVYRKTSRAR